MGWPSDDYPKSDPVVTLGKWMGMNPKALIGIFYIKSLPAPWQPSVAVSPGLR